MLHGDGNTQNNNYRTSPRIITKDSLLPFILYFPIKDVEISFQYGNIPNSEMINVKLQIVEALKELGYTNFAKTKPSVVIISEKWSRTWGFEANPRGADFLIASNE